MRKLTATLCLTVAVLLGSAGRSESADYQKGKTAYNRGDYATALREWKPLAEQGNADAQNNLGVMFYKGRGVIQDNGYKTVTGKRFYANHAFSIIKNKRLRDGRLDALPEDRFEISSPLRIEYVERKLINEV